MAESAAMVVNSFISGKPVDTRTLRPLVIHSSVSTILCSHFGCVNVPTSLTYP